MHCAIVVILITKKITDIFIETLIDNHVYDGLFTFLDIFFKSNFDYEYLPIDKIANNILNLEDSASSLSNVDNKSIEQVKNKIKELKNLPTM